MTDKAKENLFLNNPNPDLCLARDSRVIYANIVSQSLLCQWLADTGKFVPPRWEELIKECLDSNTNKTDEVTYKDKVFSFVMMPVAEEGYVNVYGSEITTYKRALEEIKMLKQEIEFILGATKTGLDIIDSDFNIRYIDPEWQKVYGDPKGKKCFEYFMGKKQECPGCGVRKALETKKPVVTEEKLVKEGNRPIQVITIPFQNDKGEWLVAEVNVDITERKEVERFKNEIINVVSHESLTSLTFIRENISQILEGILGETTDRQQHFLSLCLKAVEHLIHLIDNMTDISKVEAGKIGLKRERVNIKELVETIADSFLPQAQSKKLQIRTHIPENIREVYIDKDRITQVFSNLVGNALKFTQAGYIDISVEDKHDYIECSVLDTGRGIDGEDLPRVFGKFQQFGEALNHEKGTGLGLSISKGIVQLHGGHIFVESKLNQGTKFTFTLPKYSQADILKESIKERIAAAQKEYEEFTVFLFKVDNYDDIEKELGKSKAEDIFLKLLGILERAVRVWETVMKAGKNEAVVLADVGEHNASKMCNSLKRVIKEFIFKQEGIPINFSYGYSVYPHESGDISSLLKNTYVRFKSEKEEQINKRILIVDDEPPVAFALKRILETKGYTSVKEFFSGQGVLNYLVKEKCDLIILDMKMPAMSGYEVIGRLKESIDTKDIPILIMSGYAVETDKLEDYLSQKAILTLAKPFDEKQIDRLLAYIL